jgi:hypothetical protein
MNTHEEVAKFLHAVGVESVRAAWDGCGDDGSLTSVECVWRSGVAKMPDGAIRAELEEFLYDAIADEYRDWEANAGSMGEVILSIDPHGAMKVVVDGVWNDDGENDDDD